jgi:uncharacterized protein YndB with AHSA1/START domain
MSKFITTNVTINAPVRAVWQALTNLHGYRRWNPFITAAAGTIGAGERLDLTISPPVGRPVNCRPWVTAVEHHRHIEWRGRRLARPG